MHANPFLDYYYYYFNLFLKALAYNEVLDERQGCLNGLQPNDVAVVVLQISRH